MAAIVYLATNRINGKRYIGATGRGLEKRRRQHETAPNTKTVTCRYFHAAMRKHGSVAFDWTVIAHCEDLESALGEEVRLIADIKPEYNLTAGGQGATGAVFSAERRAKISTAKLGMKQSAEHTRNNSLARKGKKQSPEAIEKRRQSMIGLPCKPEHREKIRVALIGRKRPPQVVARMLATRARTFAETAAKPWIAAGISKRYWFTCRKKSREAVHAGL